MKKKIVADLTSLAHKVLQLKNHDTTVLKNTAQQLYDTLSVLEFVEKHFETPGPTIGKARALEIIELVTHVDEPAAAPAVIEKETTPAAQENVEKVSFSTNSLSNLFMPVDEDTREEMDLPGINTISKMVEEMPDALPDAVVLDFSPPETPANLPPVPATPAANRVDTAASKTNVTTTDDLMELTAAFQTMPEFERKTTNEVNKSQSLNDRLNKGLVIGINDRLGFVKHLFGGSDHDLNRVLSQLNSMESLAAAKDFVETMVKPDYDNWAGKEQYETRFMDLLERKFES